MANWEYRRIAIKTSGGIFRQIRPADDYTPVLNEAGRDGWELAAAIPMTEGHGRVASIEFVFKRLR
ncbi:MAG TPA: DUF4177 domain-containing protein [candidate division Zixibacteria bacterium]|jgi:hypothetical protein